MNMLNICTNTGMKYTEKAWISSYSGLQHVSSFKSFKFQEYKLTIAIMILYKIYKRLTFFPPKFFPKVLIASHHNKIISFDQWLNKKKEVFYFATDSCWLCKVIAVTMHIRSYLNWTVSSSTQGGLQLQHKKHLIFIICKWFSLCEVPVTSPFFFF